MLYEFNESRNNCLQWGLWVLTAEDYYQLLKEHAIEVEACAYGRICREKNREHWYWAQLWCEIKREKKWMNIGTGRRGCKFHSNIIATFEGWSDYEEFREALRKLVSDHFEENPPETIDPDDLL